MADKNNFAEELYKNTDKRAFDKAKFKNEILSENKRNASNRQVGNDDADKDGGLFEKAKDVANVVSYINPLTAPARLAYDVATHPEEVKDWTKAAAGVVGDAVSSMFSDKDSYTGIKDSELPNHISKRSKSFRTLSDEDKTEHLKQKFYLLSGKKDKPGEGMAQTDYLKSIANSKPISGEDVLTGNGQTVNTNLYGYTQDEIDYANKVIKDQKDNIAETKKQLKELSEFTGKKIKDSEDRKSTNWVAKKLYEDAKDMADAPFKGDLDDTNAIANYGRGVKSGARAENIPFAGAVYSKRVEDETQEALRAFNKAQENWAKSHKQGDEMTAEDVKKAIGEDKFEIVSAAYTLAEVSQMRENNLSLAYQSGQSLAQSLSMMAEMLIARKALGKVFGKVGKMDKVLDKKMARNWKNGNYGSAAGNFMQQRLINAPSSAVATVPMAVKNIEQAETERAMKGEEMTTKDYISATADAAIETFTETGGGKLLDIGNDALKKQAGKAFKSTLGKTKAWKFAENMGGKLPKDFKRYVNFVKNTDIANEVLQSPISEYQEEFLGAGLGLAKGTLLGGEYYEDAKDEMAYMLSREGNVVTAGSVLPMTLLPSFIGGGLKMAAAKRSAKAVGKYGKILTDQIDKMDISDNEKADRKKKLADYITSRKGNLDDNEAEYIAGQMGLDVQSISTLKKYANSVKSYYETGDIDTLTKDMSAEDKQVVSSMLTAWWKVRFDGANERYNNYVAAKEKLKQATSERNELVKKLGGTNLAIARTQELFEKYKDNTISEEEDAELRTLMNIDVQEAEDEYKSAYESMRNPGVRSNSKSDVKAQQGQNPVMQPTTDGTKRTSVSYSRRLPNGTIQRGTIYDENGFTDEEVKTGRIKATEHPDAALQTEDGRYDILDMGVDDLIIEPTTEEKDREEARAIAEETRRQEQMEADEISGLESAIQSGEKTQKQDAMSYLKNKYDGEDFLEEGENLSDVVDFLRDATDGRSFEEKMDEVMDSIKPKFRNLFRGMAQSIAEGNADISEADVISLFDDIIEEEEQPMEESGVIEDAKQRLLSNISALPKNDAIESLRAKVAEVRTVMATASAALSNIQSQIDSENTDDNMKTLLENAKPKHNELLRKAQSDYEVLMSAIEEYDADLFNELSSQESQSESETTANNSMARRSEEKRKEEANPERKGKTSVAKRVLDDIDVMRAQGMTDEQIADAVIGQYKNELNKARKLERRLARQKKEREQSFLDSFIKEADVKIAETEKYLGERNATLSQMEEIIKGFGPEAEQKLADTKFTKKEQQDNKLQAMADEFKGEAEADLDGFINGVDNSIDECERAIAEERLRIENKKAASPTDKIKSNGKISDLEESLRQWEYIRQRYAKDGKSRRDGAATADEYYKAEKNRIEEERAKNDEETQRAIAEKKAEREARREENRRKMEEERAKKAEEQNEQPATIEGSDNTNEGNGSEEPEEVDRKGLMSDKEIEKYEDDIFYGLFDGKWKADDKYLEQARFDLEQTDGQIEKKKAEVSNAEEIIKEMEEAPDYWTSNGVDPNEGIAKYKESITKLSDDIKWLDETKAETERYIASKEAQMKARRIENVSEDKLAKDWLNDKIDALDVDDNVKGALKNFVGWFYAYNYGHGRTHKNDSRHNVMSNMLVLQGILDGHAETDKEKAMQDFAKDIEKTKLINKLPVNYEDFNIDIECELLGEIIDEAAKFLESSDNEQKNAAIMEIFSKRGNVKIASAYSKEKERAKAERKEAAKNVERDREGREAAKEAITSAKEYISQRKDGKARDERIEDEDGRVTTGLYMMDGRVMTGKAYEELSDEDKGRCKELFALTGKASNGTVMTILTDKNKGCKVYLDSKGKIWSLGEVKPSALSGFSTVKEAIESDANEQNRKRLAQHNFENRAEYDDWLGNGVVGNDRENVTYEAYDIDGSKAKRLNDGRARLTNRQVLAFVNGELTYRDLIGDSAEGMAWLNERRRTEKKLDDVISDLSEFSSVLNGLAGDEIPMNTISGIIRSTVAANNKNTGIDGVSHIKAEVKKRLYNNNISAAAIDEWNRIAGKDEIRHTTVYWMSRTGEEKAPENPYEEARNLRNRVINELRKEGVIATEETMKKKLDEIRNGEKKSRTEKTVSKSKAEKRKQAVDDLAKRGQMSEEEAARRKAEIDEKTEEGLPTEPSAEAVREKTEEDEIVKSLEDAYDNKTLTAEIVKDALDKLGAQKFSAMNIREDVGKKIAEIMMRNEITDSEMTDDEIEAEAEKAMEEIGREAGNGASELLKAGEAKTADEILTEEKEREEEAKSEKVKDWFQDFLKTHKGAKFIKAKRILNAIVKTELTAGEYSELKAEVEQAVSTGDYTELEDMVDEIKSSHASGSVKAHASGGMVSRTARRYAKQVLRHMKKIAKASHGRLGVYTLSELMNEGKAKTAFARAVIERAMINGITPAQAAKELLEQRGEARMMASRNAGSQLTFAHGIRKPQGIDLMLLSSAIMTQSNTFGKLTSELADKNDGSVVKKVILYGNHAYLWSTENGYDFFIEQKLTINEKNYQAINDLLETYGTDEFTEGNIDIIQRSEDKETRSRSLADLAKSTRDRFYNRQSAGDEQTSNRTGVNEYTLSDTQSEENGGVADNVQLMEGSDGTVYGWCEIERDAEGNVVARHIYLNDEVLNANTMVHELGHLWLNLLSEINPKLYEHGLGLAKKHPLFAELKESDEYGMLSDDEIADEVLARMIGDSFDLLAEYTESKEDRDRVNTNQLSDVIGRLRKFFKKMFGEIRSAFGEKWTDEEIEELRLSDFAKMALKDIISGKTVEEWAARTIGGETLDRVERIDRELNDKDMQIPPERVSMAAAAANKLLVSNVGTNVSAMTQFVKYWNNVFRMLFKGNVKKARRAITIENSDGDLPILMLYQAMNEYRRSIGEDEIDMHNCPYYDWEGMETAVRNKQTKATEDLVKGSLIPKTEAAIAALSMLRDKNGKMIGKKKAAELLDVYLMSHSAVERKSKGKNIRTGESTFEEGLLNWIKNIEGFEGVGGIESLVDAVLAAKESNEDINKSIDELWDSIRSITSYYRTLMYDHGCITAELRNEWENDYYVPNKGVMKNEDIDLDDTDEYMYMSWLQANETRRTDNSSRTLTTSSKGGKSLGTGCLENLFKQMNAAIAHVTVNDYRKVLFYDLAENKEFGEASGLFKIEEGGKAKLHAKNSGEAARLRTVVVHNGELYTIVWGSDEEGADNRHGNLLIADAVNGNRLRIRDGFFSAIAKFTKVVQSLCYTTWRVGFFMGELFRQYCTRSMSIFINEAEKGFIHIPLAVLKSLYDFVNIPSFVRRQTRLWVSAMVNATTSQIQQKMPYFEEFQENAGNAGFTTSDMYEDYNALKNLARGLEESSRTGETKASMMKTLRATYRVITAWQKAQDVTNRYIVYEKCRKEGMSARDAARMSRNVGPNFLKTGRGGYGACIPIQLGLFYNATIQGIKNMFKKYYSGDSFTGTNLTGEQRASRITAGAMMQASVLLMGYCLATGVFYGGGDDDDRWRQSLDRGDELFFNNTLHNFMTEGNGYWLSKFVSIPEEWRMLYSVGAFISQQQHGMITKSECARRMVRAVVEGAIPFNNTVKSFLYGATDYVYNKYNGTGLNTQSMMANAVRNGVLDDISVIAEPSKILFSGEIKQTYDGGDRRDNNRLPSYLSKIVDPHKQVSGNVELFLMKQFGTDVALDVTPVAEGALQVFDGVYGLFASHDSPVADELDKYATDAYSKMTFENIRKMRGMVKEVKERANALDAIANEKWHLADDDERRIYKTLTGTPLTNKDGSSKKESNDYSYTTQARIARKKKLEYYVDMDEALKQIQDPETFKNVMWEEYQNWVQEKMPRAKTGMKKEFNTQQKIDDYTMAYKMAMWQIKQDRKELNGEPGSLELALIAKFEAKRLKDLAKWSDDAVKRALIYKLNERDFDANFNNFFKKQAKGAELTEADDPEFELVGNDAMRVYAEANKDYALEFEASRNRLIDEHIKMVKYRDSRKK